MKSNLKNIEEREFLPGFYGKMIHTDRMTLAYWEIKADSSLPKHHHHHEQVVNMLEGEFELTLDGTPYHLYPGDILVIAGNVPHSGRAITDCKILDVFTPAREDYQ
jgi:quercetin dioxygenase-like cupin family protein